MRLNKDAKGAPFPLLKTIYLIWSQIFVFVSIGAITSPCLALEGAVAVMDWPAALSAISEHFAKSHLTNKTCNTGSFVLNGVIWYCIWMCVIKYLLLNSILMGTLRPPLKRTLEGWPQGFLRRHGRHRGGRTGGSHVSTGGEAFIEGDGDRTATSETKSAEFSVENDEQAAA